MTRRYDESVEVRRRDEAPAEFLWRGRLYVVRDVLSHWVETGAWWRGAAARSVLGLGANSDMDRDTDRDRDMDSDSGAQSSAMAGAALAADVSIDDEHEVWRVEASAGRVHGTGVFDLSFDWSHGSWTLLRAMD
jgi:hypothetical protein